MITTKTITFHADYNYGAVLQAYSLQQYLIENGFDNEIIDFRHPNTIGYGKFFDYGLCVRKVINNAFKLRYASQIKRYRKKMLKFVSENMYLTRRYETYEQLCLDIPKSDCYICGSDQIWNIHNKIRKEFFLDFPTEGKKIAYAPSFGVKYFDDFQEAYIKKALDSFSAISTRELVGVNMLQSMGFTEAVQCVDPVFLHSKSYWAELAKDHSKKTPKEKYILVYSLHYDSVLREAISQLRRDYGYEICVITNSGRTRIDSCNKIIDASPLEFLHLIMNAEFVLASSFHGLAFSIIFQKNFAVFAQPLTGMRVIDMLELVNLEDRRIGFDKPRLPTEEIDYGKVSPLLNKAIEKSKTYLLEAING